MLLGVISGPIQQMASRRDKWTRGVGHLGGGQEVGR